MTEDTMDLRWSENETPDDGEDMATKFGERPGSLVRVGDYGPRIKLREPWTRESLIAAVMPEDERGWRCRRGKHRREVVGDPYSPPASAGDTAMLMESVFAMIANTDTSAMSRCRRCGNLSLKSRF